MLFGLVVWKMNIGIRRNPIEIFQNVATMQGVNKKTIFHYENRKDPLLPRRDFLLRMLQHLGVGSLVISFSLGIGILGYHCLEAMSWVDALLNAAMILSGMGPVNTLLTVGGKVFASVYALFSGVVFLATTGVIIAPLVHRILHRMHLDEGDSLTS